MKIVFMGTPDFAAVILQALLDSEHEICGVATQPDKAKDRGKKIQLTPVKELAISHGIPVLQPERVRGNAAFLQTLADWQPDLCVVAAYGQILPKEVLELPKLGCINVHASLLPKLRGASPIQQAIVSGETETGVTIMQMAEGLHRRYAGEGQPADWQHERRRAARCAGRGGCKAFGRNPAASCSRRHHTGAAG